MDRAPERSEFDPSRGYRVRKPFLLDGRPFERGDYFLASETGVSERKFRQLMSARCLVLAEGEPRLVMVGDAWYEIQDESGRDLAGARFRKPAAQAVLNKWAVVPPEELYAPPSEPAAEPRSKAKRKKRRQRRDDTESDEVERDDGKPDSDAGEG